MNEPAIEIEVPDRAMHPLASIIAQRWNRAVRWRSQETIGGQSLKHVLDECYQQREGVQHCGDLEVLEDLGVNISVNLSGLKSAALVSWMRDLLLNTADLPFTLVPAPIPSLSEESRQIALNKVKQHLFNSGGSADITELVRRAKHEQHEAEKIEATRAADAMYDLIKDQCQHGGFTRAMLKMLNDFAVYPFAAIHGPVPTMVTTMKWQGNTLKAVDEVQFQFKPLSVFDVFWTPDSRDAQSGTAVLVRERITKQELYKCAGMKSYNKQAVLKVLEDYMTGRLYGTWLSRNPEQPSHYDTAGFGNGETLEVIRHYGVLSGRELMSAGVTGLDEHDFYESTVAMIGHRIIQVHISPNPEINIRPVYLASFEQSGDRIPGFSICQKIRDIERAYHATLRYMMVNVGYSSGPIGEVDYSRIQKYMAPEDVGKLSAMTLYPVDADMTGGGRPAHYFHNIPSNVSAFMGVSQFFMDLADRVTQIPASIHGEPVGTGANRTFRGMAMLYGNAIKPIQSAIANLDINVFSPMGSLMYNYNMKYSKDDSVRGDARIIAQGSTGLIQKEVAKQTALDTLQLVATAGSAAQGMINPNVVRWAVDAALRAAGVPDEVLDAVQEPTPQPEQIPNAGTPALTNGQGIMQ